MKKILFLILIITACGEGKKPTVQEIPQTVEQKTDLVKAPGFSADSAYLFIQKQLEFGYRIPGTDSHRKTGDYLVKKLSSYGAKVYEQTFTAPTWDGNRIPLRNIIGSFSPQIKKRILLAAHWDSRPYGDKDPDQPGLPIAGANDGASGVAVLLEIARVISIGPPPTVGIDIIFFDGEDWGETIDSGNVPPAEGYDSWWCLGSQYWSKNKHLPGYSAYFGILLDMVGAKNSTFHMEGVSRRYAPKIVKKVWDAANSLGHGLIFMPVNQAEITDDHLFVNEYAKIPMIDIVHFDRTYGYFGEYHHTQKDNIEIIDPQILKAVGETVLHVVYNE